jgi:hypothetical protein
MKSLLLAAGFVAASSVSAVAQDIGGVYSVQGTGLNGNPYSGTAVIEGITDTTCSIVWETGGQSSEGVCMRYGPAFSAFYVIETPNGPAFGLVIYQVLENGSLDGIWTVTGENGSGTEVLTPQ